ncbi:MULTISPECIES: hypothetical protein [Pseudomonas]|uniref:hypothetical protein n=1 Tax=Pseudomonas TaxID=286 RepID=UPI000DAEBBBE|nr:MULTISPECIES: hypothetical protein [Pseudomonas]MCA5974447.1 hypothetical protein [Pseudomonas sp. P135]MCH5536556.1 hypothetical protein [Pseudomonas syringae pv. syringae]MCH5570866.1 hypothetical protein [Pseudomonas syringae pv. syringae]
MPNTELGLITVTPDAMAQGLLKPLLDALNNADIYIVAAIPHRFSMPEVLLLYQDRITHDRKESRTLSNWLSPRSFTAGGSVVLAVRSRKAHPQGLQPFIAALKGSSRMAEPKVGKLRAITAWCERSLSLVHSPDDEEGVDHELTLLFGPELLIRINQLEGLALERDVLRLLALHAREDVASSIFSGMPNILARGCACLYGSPIFTKKDQLLNLIDRLRRLSKNVSRQAAHEQVSFFWSALESFKKDFVALHECCKQGLMDNVSIKQSLYRYRLVCMTNTMIAACDPVMFKVDVSEELCNTFSSAGIVLDHWEEQSLHIVAAYHTDTAR